MADELLVETVTKLFAQTCGHDEVEAAEAAGWAAGVWDPFHASGFTGVSLPEELGGSGGNLDDACEVVRLAGAHAAPIPVAEAGMLGGWLLTGAGMELPTGPVTVVPGEPGDELCLDGTTLTGVAHHVPWARQAAVIVALLPDGDGDDDGWVVVACQGADARIEHRTNLAGEPRDVVHFEGIAVERAAAADGVDADAFRLRGALSRALLMAGALEAMSHLTVEYTAERQQFGRPVGRFQAVQQHLVWSAQDAALVKMAAQVAARELERGPATFEVASAKLLANQAAGSATRACHQAHGAMGMTREYPLHHLSRRLWAWRTEYGGEHEWSTRIGRTVAAAGADRLYPIVTGGSRALAAS